MLARVYEVKSWRRVSPLLALVALVFAAILLGSGTSAKVQTATTGDMAAGIPTQGNPQRTSHIKPQQYLNGATPLGGTCWSVVPSPNVGTSLNYLWGVAAVSANDVWAVGAYIGGSGR